MYMYTLLSGGLNRHYKSKVVLYDKDGKQAIDECPLVAYIVAIFEAVFHVF